MRSSTVPCAHASACAAGAAHRPDRARFRAGARHARRGDHPGAEARRLAHGAVALPAAAQGLHRQGGLGAHGEGRRALSPPRAHARHAGARAAACRARGRSPIRRCSRAISASPRSRSWCAIPIRSSRATSSSSTRSMPSRWRRAPPIAARSSTMCWATSREHYPKALPAHAQEDPARARRGRIRRDRGGLPGALCGMVAALHAAGDGIRACGSRTAVPDLVDVYAERSGALPIPLADGTIFTSARPRRPDRAPARRRLHHRRFQDRPAAGRAGSLCGLLAAADARGDDADEGRLQGPAHGEGDAGPALHAHHRRARADQAARDRADGRGNAPRRRDRRGAPPPLRGHDRALRQGRSGVSVAALPEICAPLSRNTTIWRG